MEKLKYNYNQLLRALETLQKTLDIFTNFEERVCSCATEDREESYRIHRDSAIQRFEYTIDIFWKYLKKYLENAHVSTGTGVPIEIVRTTYAHKLASEDEAEQIIKMIKSRNMTSHMYVEEFAERLAGAIPGYYKVMFDITKRLLPNELQK